MKIFTLSKSETADLITKIKEIWPADTVQKVKVLKIIEIEDGKRIIKSDDESLIAVQKDNSIVPFINSSNIDRFASVHVDMGAVKFICNGAKIMRPGITKYDSFNKGDVVVVRDTNHLKVLASGLALVSSSELTEMTKGFVIDNIHYISDRFWETYKEI